MYSGQYRSTNTRDNEDSRKSKLSETERLACVINEKLHYICVLDVITGN